MNFDFSETERAALAAMLRATINTDPFPLSPRIRALRSILEELEPAAPRAEPIPAPKPPGEQSSVLGKGKRRR